MRVCARIPSGLDQHLQTIFEFFRFLVDELRCSGVLFLGVLQHLSNRFRNFYILSALDDEEKYGIVLRAKGIVEDVSGAWLHFDHVPGEINVRNGTAAVTGRLCVIGSKLNEKALAELFGV